jgi:hypothetical protein
MTKILLDAHFPDWSLFFAYTVSDTEAGVGHFYTQSMLGGVGSHLRQEGGMGERGEQVLSPISSQEVGCPIFASFNYSLRSE